MRASFADDVAPCLSCWQHVVARWPGSITCAPGIVLPAHHHRLTHGDLTLQSQGFQAKNTLEFSASTPNRTETPSHSPNPEEE
ncbi:hypothetical protein Q8A67_021262 [Cirrhinus molitorella]|uniref:Uncharacterized protein n=1 Tax=Cirrhinus molitorella TaxID=172907 RepID=A0AA88P380_9TELE|nr:hypothetical protein Q8A67_021262 [Cirrhinus molitorella]